MTEEEKIKKIVIEDYLSRIDGEGEEVKNDVFNSYQECSQEIIIEYEAEKRKYKKNKKIE